MSSDVRTALFVLLALGLFAVVAVTALEDDLSSGFVGISELFEQNVDACQEAHEAWPREMCERIVRGEVWEGMTAEMLVASIGEPNEIDPSQIEPTHETWTYRTARYGEEHFYMHDGILDSWEQEPCESCAVKPPRK
jgi:hypothetical protein